LEDTCRALANAAEALAESPKQPSEAVFDRLAEAETALRRSWPAAAGRAWGELDHLRRLLHELAGRDTTPVPPAEPLRTAGFPIRGTVLGPSGAGAARIPLTLMDGHGHQLRRAITGPDGHFEVHVPRPGSFLLLTVAGRFRPSVTTVVVPRHERGAVVDVVLARLPVPGSAGEMRA
jgi:hypothetical protein